MKSLNSDGQQFLQDQLTRKWTTTSFLKSLNTKKTKTHGDGIPGPGFRQAQKCYRLCMLCNLRYRF